MTTSEQVSPTVTPPSGVEGLRRQLLATVPAEETRRTIAGVSTAILTAGQGSPMVLLHGPGESAVNWRWVIPTLMREHRVIAPDLPAHGSSDVGPGALDTDGILAWLDDLIAQTCDSPPVLVGHVLGGAIAARFAIRHGHRLRRLVLVDSLGLGPFRPSLGFGVGFLGFIASPGQRSYTRFMRQCAYDLESLRTNMDDWDAFAAYNIEQARSPKAKAAGRLFRNVGLPRISSDELARIPTPTHLIWGRHDRALRLRIAEQASAAYGWRLHVIEESADDPPRDQPEAFIAALRAAVADERGGTPDQAGARRS